MKIQILEPCLSSARLVGKDIVLEGTQDISKTNHPNRTAVLETVEDTVKIENLFFYTISHHADKRFPLKCVTESGVGKLDAKNRLVREIVMEFSDRVGLPGAWFTENSKLTVSNYKPELNKCKSFFHNAIFTTDSVIELGPNSFIYCDADGDIREGNAKDLHVYINSLDKPVPFSKGINIKPSNRPRKSKIGDIIFNKNSAKLEYYDGFMWLEIGKEE